jgi:class 3 adenylate cyclase
MRRDYPEGVVTLMLTDVVGSVEMWDSDPRAMRVILERYEQVLADAVASYHGVLVREKGEGDSTFSAFRRATDAVAAAFAIQQAIGDKEWQAGFHLATRIGLHTGEVQLRAGDYYGPTANRAARVRSLAGANEVLMSRITAELAAEELPSGVALVDLGEQQLRGMRRPETVFALAHPSLTIPTLSAAANKPPAPGADDELPPPPGISAVPAFGFIGRADELTLLSRAALSAAVGTRQVVLVAGEAGVGKTSVVAEFVRQLDTGAFVLYGGCQEGLARPFSPFAEALTYVATHAPVDFVRAHLGSMPSELARLSPELAARLSIPVAGDDDGDANRARLLDAIASWLASLGRDRLVVFVVDDLHWADLPTVLAIRHLVTAGVRLPLALVATYRPEEIKDDHPLKLLLAEAAKPETFTSITLSGFDQHETTAFVSAAAGEELDDHLLTLVGALRAETSGNPLFMSEVLRHLVETGAVVHRDGKWTSELAPQDLPIPAGAQEVISRRIARLGDAACGVLQLASVIGPSFSVATVRTAATVSDDGVLDALEAAEQAALIATSDAGSFVFSHALVRDALYESIPRIRRMRLHRAVATALERLPEDSTVVIEVAAHWSACAALGAPEARQAVNAEAAAARVATGALAFEEAAAHWELALDALHLTDECDKAAECELQLMLGDALHRAGDDRYRKVLFEAAARARELGDSERMGRAALAINLMGTTTAIGTVDVELVELIEEALAGLDGDNTAMRATLLGVLAVELAYGEDRERPRRLGQQAVAIARELDDDRTLGRALFNQYAVANAPEDLDFRFALAGDIVELGASSRDREIEFRGHMLRHEQLAVRGSMPEAKAELEAMEQLARDLRQPVFRWNAMAFRSGLLMLNGELEDARQAIDDTLDAAMRAQLPESVLLGVHGILLFILHYELGRLDELREPVALLAAEQPGVPAWRAARARIHADAGRIDAARLDLDEFTSDNFVIPRDQHWTVSIACIGEVAAMLAAHDACQCLYQLLVPMSEHLIPCGVAWGGPVDRVLGLMADAVARYHVADQHFEHALSFTDRVDAPTWRARIEAHWAACISRRPVPNGEFAVALAKRSLVVARRHGLRAVIAEAESVLRIFDIATA